MPVYVDVFKRGQDPVVFRAIARELYDLPHGAWRAWEEDKFLPAMLRYSQGYVYSEKERRKLSELCWFSEEVYGHDGVTVVDMIARCQFCCADLGDSQDWIVELADRRVDFVRRRQLRPLVSLYRCTGIPIAHVDPEYDRLEDFELSAA